MRHFSNQPSLGRLLLHLVAAAAATVTPTLAQQPADLTSGQFTAGCGNATVAPIFNAALMNSGLYGENNLIVVSDPDIVLINNQWWMIFATGPTGLRAIQPFAAYLPPGASLSTTTTYPSDPNGWHLVGAQSNGQGQSYPVYPYPGTNGWDQLAAETPSVDVGPDGSVSVYYSGHNAGQTPFQIGLMTNFNAANGTATGDPNPVMGATLPWEYSAGLPALLEQSVRWIPSLNKFIMYYTAGAWWASPAPDNVIAYAESTDGINWVNRVPLDFPVAYYNQDFLYNEQHHRFEMVISKDPTGAGGANPRNIVWVESATPATAKANWLNETTLLYYGGNGFIDSGILSPSMKYGNLPGEENRLYVFFHAYDTSGNMQIGRFYCDATPSTTPTFSLSQSNPAVAVVQGNSTTMTFGVNAQSGFTSAVNFSVSGVPAGVTAALTSTSSTTGTNLNISVPTTAAAGRYPIVVTGTSGSITQTSTFTLTVTPPPNFSLTSSTNNLSLAPGAGNTMSIGVTPQNGFSGTVNLTATGFPSTVNNSLLQTSTTTGSTLVVYVQPTTAPGKYPITVTGTSGNLTASTNFTLTVTGPPGFTLTPSASGVSVTEGSGTTVNVAVNEQNGFTSAVSFAASGFPSGITGTFQQPSSATGTTLSITASSTAAVGQYQITVTGTSGALTQITSFTLSVTANLLSQTITFNPIPAQSVGTTLSVSATASSKLPVSFSVIPNGNCSISGNSVTFLNVGNCGIVANQTGNSSYAAAPAVGQVVVVNSAPAAQTITFNAIPAQTVGTTLTVSATASSGLPVTFTLVPNGNCSISGNAVKFLNVGNCGIVANQAGNSSYAAAPAVGQVVVVNSAPAAQTITFNAIPAQKVGTSLTVSATASSGLPVSFVLVQNGNCSISGNTVKFLNAGACGVIATQAGNGSYLAAPAVGQVISVN